MGNDLKAIRHYGNRAISSRGVILRQGFEFNQQNGSVVQESHGAPAFNSIRPFGSVDTSPQDDKEAFTLAEILIVLTIIGVMAVMTIPSLIQNANSQHKIAMFKKGFNAVSNAYTTEFAIKTPPKVFDDRELMWDALNNQLHVKYYGNTGAIAKYYSVEDAKKIYIGSRVIVTEDGLSYRLSDSTHSQDCKTKLDVNSYKTKTLVARNSCITVGIILDGKYRDGEDKECLYDVDLNNLNCNSIWVPVTSEGITAGNPDCTIAGRIISDNAVYDCNKCGTCENP